MNRTLLDVVRCMLRIKIKNISIDIWVYALATVVYIRNRVASSALPRKTTPYHIWSGYVLSVKHPGVFESWYSVKLPAQKFKKLEDKATQAMFIGYSRSKPGYIICSPDDESMIISPDVVTEETDEAHYNICSNMYQPDNKLEINRPLERFPEREISLAQFTPTSSEVSFFD